MQDEIASEEIPSGSGIVRWSIGEPTDDRMNETNLSDSVFEEEETSEEQPIRADSYKLAIAKQRQKSINQQSKMLSPINEGKFFNLSNFL